MHRNLRDHTEEQNRGKTDLARSGSNIRKQRVGARRRRRRRIIILIFALLFILCTFVIMRAVISLPYASVNLADLARVEYSGYNNDGVASVSVDDDAVDELMTKLKDEYDSAWFHTSDAGDADYAAFRQSLDFKLSQSAGLSNGDTVEVIASCNRELADKLKLDITANTGESVVEGLRNVTKLSADEVFKDLEVSFTGTSPMLEISIANNSPHPFIQTMAFEIADAKEYYTEGEEVTIRAHYTEEASMEYGYITDGEEEGCEKGFVAHSDSAYITNVADLPKDIIRKAVDAGKGAFGDANEYGVRIFCEANLVPVYINKKATFTYGTPNYVSSYFKTVFPEKAGELGLSFNDLDIIYDVTISQADGKACTAYAAVRFSNIIRNSDGSYTYDFSDPQILSESYYSARVKKVVVDSYLSTHNVERVNP